MKIMVLCMECFFAAAPKDQAAIDKATNDARVFAELNDRGLVHATCKQGHSVATVLQAQHFQLLFDLGTLAFLDGYHRESVTAFAASLERFLEFVVRVIARQAGTPEELVEAVWKEMARQSERQVGAYLSLFVSTFRRQPPLLVKSSVELRNEVTHKGKIPAPDEVEKYADDVLRVIRDILTSIWPSHVDSVHKQIAHTMAPRAREASKASPPVSMGHPMVVELFGENAPAVPSFAEARDALVKRRGWYAP